MGPQTGAGTVQGWWTLIYSRRELSSGILGPEAYRAEESVAMRAVLDIRIKISN